MNVGGVRIKLIIKARWRNAIARKKIVCVARREYYNEDP